MAEAARPDAQLDPDPRFLCDRMLIRLGRWLRAAGYNAAIAERSSADRRLLECAVREDRLLLTCDRKLAEFRDAPGRVLILPGAGVAAAAAALSRQRRIDWLAAPFSRCLECNVPLQHETSHAAADLHRCPVCRRLYWQGSHVRRMRAKLEQWEAGQFP